MKNFDTLWLFVLIALSVLQVSFSDGTSKLQIGVKKRIPNCDVRTKKGDILHIHYIGSLISDGKVFDESYERGEPLVFNLGSGNVIKGWDQGLLGMCEGEKRVLKIPSELAYGKSGAPPNIPPDAALKFDVELVKIERREEL